MCTPNCEAAFLSICIPDRCEEEDGNANAARDICLSALNSCDEGFRKDVLYDAYVCSPGCIPTGRMVGEVNCKAKPCMCKGKTEKI